MKKTEKIEKILGELRILTEQGKIKWEVYKDAFETNYKNINFVITMPDDEEDIEEEVGSCWAFLIDEHLMFLFDTNASPYISDITAQFHFLLNAINKAENTADVCLGEEETQSLDKAFDKLNSNSMLN